MASPLGSCIICCCSFRPDKIAALPCGHTFHYDCILPWVQSSKTCPSCRVRCVDRSVIKQLFFNTDLDATIDPGEDELDSVKKQLHEKKQECVEMEKKMKSALSEAAVNLKERARWQREAEKGKEAIQKVGTLKQMLVDQSEKDKEIKELQAKLKATKFYQLITTGASEDKLKKFIRDDGEVDTGHFISSLQKQLKESSGKIKEEKKRREEAESNILKYKRLVQELQGKEANGSLVDRLNQMGNEKRLSLGGDTGREEFSDSFLGSAMRPAPKGRINIGRRKEEEEVNTFLDIPSASRRGYHSSPEKDIFDVVMPKKVSDRIGRGEKSGNGMGSAFSMKNSADRHILPSIEKENRPKPYERVVPKKKVVANNARLSDFFQKKKPSESNIVDLDSTICID